MTTSDLLIALLTLLLGGPAAFHEILKIIDWFRNRHRIASDVQNMKQTRSQLKYIESSHLEQESLAVNNLISQVPVTEQADENEMTAKLVAKPMNNNE